MRRPSPPTAAATATATAAARGACATPHRSPPSLTALKIPATDYRRTYRQL